jgi:purine-nucleoside phosphorylase
MNSIPANHSTVVVAKAAAFIRARWNSTPRIALILGTGLGGLVDLAAEEVKLRCAEIPGFLQSTALAHAGCMVGGTLEGVSIAILQGRCHLYEGHGIESLVLPTRVMRALGATTLIVTNASGGLNPRYQSGDVMIIEDHLNFHFRKPASAPSRDVSLRPDAACPYSTRLAHVAQKSAQASGSFVQTGIYAAMLGPIYETRAEYRMLRRLGADAVGMSTVPESLVGAELGMEVLGLSVITNVAKPDAIGIVDAQEVCDIATSAAPVVRAIVRGIASQQYGNQQCEI